MDSGLALRAPRNDWIASVMPDLVPGIHILNGVSKKDVDGRVKPGHDKK
jgi:hypothetical protein